MLFWSVRLRLTLSGSTDSAPDDLAPASVRVFVLEQQKLFIKIGSQAPDSGLIIATSLWMCGASLLLHKENVKWPGARAYAHARRVPKTC